MMFPEIDPIAFQLGPLAIRWYSLAYLFGFLLGWRYALQIAGRDPDQRPNTEDIDGFLPWAVLGVIFGGRLGYVLFYNLGYYLQEPAQILYVWQGGMSFHGGMLGAFAMIIGYALALKIPVLRLGDLVACVVPIGLFLGRLANFANAELYGRVTDASWGVVFPGGGTLPRHPSQLYEAALEGLVLFLIMFFLAQLREVRARSGLLSGIFLSLYALMRIFVECFREPDAQIGLIANIFTLGQLLSIPMFIIGGALILHACKNTDQKTTAA